MKQKCISCYQEIDHIAKHYKCTACGKPVHKHCAIKKQDKPYCDLCFTAGKHKRAPIVMPEVIRRSHIETYRSCPYKFYMEVMKGLEQPENVYTKVGIDVHDIIDRASQDFSSVSLESAIQDFKEKWVEYSPDLFTDETHKEKMYDRAISSLTTAWDVIPYLPEPFSTEEKIEFCIDPDMPRISCTSDRTHLSGDGLEVIDWKTGQPLVGVKHSSDLQAPLYIYSISQKYKKPVKKFTFYYLDSNKTRIYNYDGDENYSCQVGKRTYRINLQDALKEVKRVFSKIKQNQFNIPVNDKSMYFTCKMCHLRERGICEGVEVQSWKNKGEFDWHS